MIANAGSAATACKKAGVKNYGKMTVEVMRAALAAVTTLPEVSTPPVVKAQTMEARVRAVEQNGVRRPAKGVCADVWVACDALLAQGTAPNAAAIRELGDTRGWNRGNVSIELSRWRRFNGVERPKKS
jgi:hypothetical protein